MTLDEIRAKFPITRNYNFQNHAGIAPISGPAAEALAGYAREVSQSAYLEGTYYRAAERVRQAAAQLLGADTEEVTFVKSTSEGINYVAGGIQWVTGDNVVSTLPGVRRQRLSVDGARVARRGAAAGARRGTAASCSTAWHRPSTSAHAWWRSHRCSSPTASAST